MKEEAPTHVEQIIIQEKPVEVKNEVNFEKRVEQPNTVYPPVQVPVQVERTSQVQVPAVKNSSSVGMEKAVLKTSNVIDKDNKKNSKKRPGKTDDANDTCGCLIF